MGPLEIRVEGDGVYTVTLSTNSNSNLLHLYDTVLLLQINSILLEELLPVLLQCSEISAEKQCEKGVSTL